MTLMSGLEYQRLISVRSAVQKLCLFALMNSNADLRAFFPSQERPCGALAAEGVADQGAVSGRLAVQGIVSVLSGECRLPILRPIVFWRENHVPRYWKTLFQGVNQVPTPQKTLFWQVGRMGEGWKTLFRDLRQMGPPWKTLFRHWGRLPGPQKTLFQGSPQVGTRRKTLFRGLGSFPSVCKTLFRGRGTFPSVQKRVFWRSRSRRWPPKTPFHRLRIDPSLL